MRIPWYLRPGYGVSNREKVNRLADSAARAVGFRLPRRVAYWAVIATALKVSPNGPQTLNTTADEMLRKLS